MARLRRDARLQTREARLRLPPSPDNMAYWRPIERKLALGYYKGPQGGTWYVRSRKGTKYRAHPREYSPMARRPHSPHAQPGAIADPKSPEVAQGRRGSRGGDSHLSDS
jgi:hypothetical protein